MIEIVKLGAVILISSVEITLPRISRLVSAVVEIGVTVQIFPDPLRNIFNDEDLDVISVIKPPSIVVHANVEAVSL